MDTTMTTSTKCYAIQDVYSKLFLSKDNNLTNLSSTTRLYKSRKAALKAIDTKDYLFWLCVNEYYNKTKQRVTINDDKFKIYKENRRKEVRLHVSEVILKEQ